MEISTPALDKKMPVVLCITTDNLLCGGASTYDGSILASIGELVVVTVNIRTGILGTAAFDKDGNWCLTDVISALKWIKNYIGEFGGDAECVTLMGHGINGLIVDALMNSHMSSNVLPTILTSII